MKRFATVAALLVFSATAYAADPMVSSEDPNSVVSVLNSAGYVATLTKAKNGNPQIDVHKGDAAYTIGFLSCTAHVKCQKISFYSAWGAKGVTPQILHDRWYATVTSQVSPYIRTDGSLGFSVAQVLAPGGMSRALFLANVDDWIRDADACYSKVTAQK